MATGKIPTPGEIAAKRQRAIEPQAEPYIARIVAAIEDYKGQIWYSSEVPFAIVVPLELRNIVRSRFSAAEWDVTCSDRGVLVSLERPCPDSSEGNRG